MPRSAASIPLALDEAERDDIIYDIYLYIYIYTHTHANTHTRVYVYTYIYIYIYIYTQIIIIMIIYNMIVYASLFQYSAGEVGLSWAARMPQQQAPASGLCDSETDLRRMGIQVPLLLLLLL